MADNLIVLFRIGADTSLWFSYGRLLPQLFILLTFKYPQTAIQYLITNSQYLSSGRTGLIFFRKKNSLTLEL